MCSSDLYAISFIFVYFLYQTNYFISDLYEYFWGYYPKAGIIHPIFLVFVFSIVCSINFLFFINWLKIRKETSLYRYKSQYILLAFFIFSLGIIDFIPNYGIEIYPFGWVFTILFSFIIAYAILKYQLMDISVVIKKAFFYSVGIAIASGIVVSVSFLSSWLMENISGFRFWTIPLIAGIAAFVIGNLFWRKSKQVEKAYEVEKQAHKELKHLSEVKDQFILATQHHLRTPLTIMKGYLSVVLEKHKESISKEVENYLTKTSDSTNRLIKLVNELLDVSQLEIGKKPLKIEPTNVRNIIDDTIKDIQPEIEKNNLVIKILPENIKEWPNIPADPEKLMVVFANLIDNAVKYSSQGEIIIQGKFIPSSIKGKTNSSFQISIKDQGIGINTDEIPTLFTNYFERGEEAQKLYTTGRGIGLFITASIIKAHNGRIWAESRGYNKGATFYVELPMGQN